MRDRASCGTGDDFRALGRRGGAVALPRVVAAVVLVVAVVVPILEVVGVPAAASSAVGSPLAGASPESESGDGEDCEGEEPLHGASGTSVYSPEGEVYSS